MSGKKEDNQIQVEVEEIERLMQCLPRATSRGQAHEMIKYQNSWYYINFNQFKNFVTFQKHFVARDNDIFITGLAKTGTTWLKSLLFTTVNRVNHPIERSPLLSYHPHELVYNLEGDVYGEAFEFPRPHHLNELPSPRLLSTHVPYTSLSESIKTSECRMVYICRNPLDMLVSYYYFSRGIVRKMAASNKDHHQGDDEIQLRLEDFFEDFCDGKILCCSFFEHVLEFWKISLEQPNKVLFLKYEELKDDPILHLKRLAEFIGMPFSPQEENEGVIQQIIDFCDIKNMKELDVNKSGVINKFFEKKTYFRKGEVGDWINHFTPSMVERMNKLMEEKFKGTDLFFKLLP